MASKASISTMDVRNPDQKVIDSQLSSFISQYLPGFVPGADYGKDLSAPMTGFENQGMSFLQNYLTGASDTNANPMLGLAENELTKTFTGGYDPSTSPFFKATRDAAMVERQDALNTQNQGLGARGKFFSSEALRENQQLNTRTTNFLNQTLTGMAEKERMNRLNAVPMAMNLDSARTKADLSPIIAATTFGSIPREVEQQDLERQYQKFLNEREEKALPLTAARGAYSNMGLKTVATQAKPGFDWGSFLGQVGVMAAGAALTGGIGAALAPAAGAVGGAGGFLGGTGINSAAAQSLGLFL